MAEWFLIAVGIAVMLMTVITNVKMLLALNDLKEAATVNVSTQEAIQEAARIVAEDLKQRYVRADATEGAPGEAADVAARSEPDL